MDYIAHRINTIEELKMIHPRYGVELDLRYSGNRLVLQHDPFKDGDDFEEYLRSYKHRIMIINVKSEGIEERALALIKRRRIKRYFFLDSSFPMIYKLSKIGERNMALRFSELECIDTVLAMKKKAVWAWVDCFTKLPIDKGSYKALKRAGFKLCLVSPELQGRPEDIEKYKRALRKRDIAFDAICTKFSNIGRWQ